MVYTQRTCDHCGKSVAEDQPIHRVVGYDDRVCTPCLEIIEKINGEPITQYNSYVKEASGMIVAKDLERRGMSEQALRLLEIIVKENKQKTERRE